MRVGEPINFIPFNGDSLLHGEIGRLIGKWGVEVAVETGTYHGSTTVALSLLCSKVFTFENIPENSNIAESIFETLNRGNIYLIRQSSDKGISDLVDDLKGHRVIYYLDAHWQDHWPLLNELKAIAMIGGPKPIIVIHDFKVPGRPELGFDCYKNSVLNLDYVSEEIDKIFQGRSCFHFNSLALGKRRGAIFIEPEM